MTLQERVHGATPPPSWRNDKLHRVLRVRRGNKNKAMQEDNLLSLSYGHIKKKDIDTAEGLLPESFETYQIVEPGNIVMRLTDLQNDKRSLRQGLVKQRGIITSAYDALQVGSTHDARFWAYALLALDLAKYYYSLGGGVRQSIKFADFPNDWVAAPDLDTQKAIADFLDRETARIDQLIEKKKRLGRVLQARTSATIDNCLRDVRGEDWYRLKFVITKLEQGWSPQCDEYPVEGDIWGVLKLGAVTTGRYVEKSNKSLPPDLEPRESLRVRQGDVLVARASGSPELVGKAAYVDATTLRLMISDKHYRLVPREGRAIGEYVALVINSTFSRQQIEARLSSAEGMARNIGQDVIKNLHLPWPSPQQQHQILKVVRNNQRAAGYLREATSQSLERLREFRSALITAAVTGQIDVTTWGKHGSTDRRLDKIEEEMSTVGAER